MTSIGGQYGFISSTSNHFPPGTVNRAGQRQSKPPCTAPRSTLAMHQRNIAAVTPENELEARAILPTACRRIADAPLNQTVVKKRKNQPKGMFQSIREVLISKAVVVSRHGISHNFIKDNPLSNKKFSAHFE